MEVALAFLQNVAGFIYITKFINYIVAYFCTRISDIDLGINTCTSYSIILSKYTYSETMDPIYHLIV